MFTTSAAASVADAACCLMAITASIVITFHHFADALSTGIALPQVVYLWQDQPLSPPITSRSCLLQSIQLTLDALGPISTHRQR